MTVDRILALCILTERLHDFRIGLLAAYVDLRKAFYSVNRDVLWRILALREIPPELANLIWGLYSGTKSAVRCDGTISDYFPVNTVVYQRCVLAPTRCNICIDHALVRMSEKSGCGVSFGTVPITDLAFADDAVIFAETTDVFAGTPDSLSEKAEPLGLRVSLITTKVQAFGDILNRTVESIPVNDENVKVTQMFTYLDSVIHSSMSCELVVNRQQGRT